MNLILWRTMWNSRDRTLYIENVRSKFILITTRLVTVILSYCFHMENAQTYISYAAEHCWVSVDPLGCTWLSDSITTRGSQTNSILHFWNWGTIWNISIYGVTYALGIPDRNHYNVENKFLTFVMRDRQAQIKFIFDTGGTRRIFIWSVQR